MHKLFYARLAITNLQKNRRTYFPYILTCIGTILMFYNACALTFHPTMHGITQQLMSMGTSVTALFSAIFLFYTHSFLLKRRKKELGLFHILGMEKRHISRIMLWESLLVAGLSIACGLLLGVIFSKLITLFLYKLLHFDPNFQFEISVPALGITVALFAAIFLLVLLCSLVQVYRSQTIDLIRGGNVGEREPKTKKVMTVVGVLSLGSGYAMALLEKNPLSSLYTFMIAVLLVMVGTYCLFAAGSIALLKGLKRNKRFYYQTQHFISISSMMYRMKQNAVGLANICLMSTAVLVMVSTTVSMYAGLQDILDTRFLKDFSIETRYTPDHPTDTVEIAQGMDEIIASGGQPVTDYCAYGYLYFATFRDGSTYSAREENIFDQSDDMTTLMAMTADEYQNLTGQSLTLSSGEAAVYSVREHTTITLLGKTYQVAKQLSDLSSLGERVSWLVDEVYVILPNQTELDQLYAAQVEAYQDMAQPLLYQVSFNLAMPEDQKEAYTTDVLVAGINSKFPDTSIQITSKQLSRASFYQLYGGLFFLGIFLGLLFLMATVLIIYYKQVVEGYDDQQRFHIMQQVGMSAQEVRQSIRSQIMTVFALPILVAIVHICVAFPILTRLLQMLNLTNVPLFAICMALTTLVFVIIYGIVYQLTARVYYKIVRQ